MNTVNRKWSWGRALVLFALFSVFSMFDASAREAKTLRIQGCPVGLEKTLRSVGHCCWPGQSWARGICQGAPSHCPPGHVMAPKRDGCVVARCRPGRVVADKAGRCCWPGQRWSERTARCEGTARCPLGHKGDGPSCVLDPRWAPVLRVQQRRCERNNGTVYFAPRPVCCGAEQSFDPEGRRCLNQADATPKMRREQWAARFLVQCTQSYEGLAGTLRTRQICACIQAELERDRTLEELAGLERQLGLRKTPPWYTRLQRKCVQRRAP